MDKEYILKHKEIPVLLFKLNEDFELSDIGKIFDNQRLPFGLKYERNEKAQYKQMSDWIENRGLPRGRSDLVYIQKDMKARNSKDLAFGSYALNLTDQYWAHKSNLDLKWNDLNFFDNTFEELISFDVNGVFQRNNKILAAPDLTVDGSLRKKWVSKDKERYLLKSSRYDESQEPFNEVIASEIMNEFGIEHVEYGLVRNESNNMPLSICKCMVNRNTEFIPAQVVKDMELKQNRNDYERFIDICKKRGINDVKEKLDEMIAIDYIIGNTDRHTGNFGIIREANSLEWIKMVPIFDNGNSFCHDVKNVDDVKRNQDTVCRWYPESNYEKLGLMEYPEWYSENKGENIKNIVYDILRKNENIKEEKREALVEIVNIRIKEFEKLIRKKKRQITDTGLVREPGWFPNNSTI